ncbi:MAG: carboxypeptidase regulatory-like domain-containing protein [Acidimicrobiia bacterium]|nr:carboxypeptidase regulatory-like domain-containing protein [Acidimicrobiia bacterium]
MQKKARSVAAGVGVAAALTVSLVVVGARQNSIAIDSDDVGGVVTSSKGPEAGVWVIAETRDLPTRFIRTVVTDDQGRYVLPDLPKAGYHVWVRGYGLVDSPKVKATPGQRLNLTAVVAPSASAAAEYYPAHYWYSLLQVPAKSEFPGTGDKGNGIPESMTSQAEWISQVSTTACVTCHQMGNKATREIPESLGRFATSFDAWARRIQSGQAGGMMVSYLSRLGRDRGLKMFADWSDRIAKGELPPVPPRPQGVERNVVLTAWEYADPRKYVHDGMSTYKSDPTVNANGPFISGPEASSDNVWVLDPVTHTASAVEIPVRDPKISSSPHSPLLQPSPYWGDEVIWTGKSAAHSTMWDRKGRLWATSAVQSDMPAWCMKGHPSANVYPLERGGTRSTAVYDPKTKQVQLLHTCFGTHHLMFGDAQYANGKYADWLFFNSGGQHLVGWVDTKMYDETKDEAKSQGWTPLILDTNGNGRRDAWVEPQPAARRAAAAPEAEVLQDSTAANAVDATKDTRLGVAFYSVIQNPVDGSVWGSVWSFPGSIVRINLGDNPPETALSEIYDAPYGYPGLSGEGNTVRGIDADRNGVIWTNLSGSGHLASFDRRKCRAPLNGPKATGKHCPEGWTVYPVPGPQFKGVTEPGSADGLYLLFVDQFDTFGLGKNVPFVTGSNSDSLMGLVDGKFVVLRVPYPLGFYAKGMDGRIDDPKAGWKGKGLWSTHGNRTPWHNEGGKGTMPQVVKFQLRPNPLAK